MQRLLAGAKWDADAVRDDLRAYVVEHLGDPRAVLVIDKTGFLKQDTKSVGVKRQYSGTAGRIENCQIGVFLTYAAPEGHVLLDRELYLPGEWANDTERRQEASVPEAVTFATKPELARQMLERALDAEVPAAWVTGASIYGGDRRLRVWLEQHEHLFVLAVARNKPLFAVLEGHWGQPRADVIAERIPAEAWQRLSAGDGAKGPRWYDRRDVTGRGSRWHASNSLRRRGSGSTGCWSAAAGVIRRSWPTTSCLRRREPPSRRWCASQDNAGISNRALHWPRGKWDSTSTKCGVGTAGTDI